MAPIHPESELPSAPPPAGAYYSVKDQEGMRGPASYRRQKRARNPCCCCLIWLCSILTILVFIIGIAVLVFWLVVHPKVPKYDVQNVHISGLSVTDSQESLNPITTFRLMANNRNKHIGIYYDEIHVMVLANGETIGDGYLPTFYQGHQNITYLDGNIGYTGLSLTQLQSTITDIVNSQPVPTNVNVDVKVRLKIGSWKSRKITVRVRCDMQLQVSGTGSQSVNNQHCKVKVRV